MPKIIPLARYGAAVFAALAGLTALTAPFNSALGAGSAPVTVVNPDTSPVPTTVRNPATMPALTNTIDDPGRIPYQAMFEQSCSTNECAYSSASVPAGHRLVIQHVAAFAAFTGQADSMLISVQEQNGGFLSNFFAQVSPNGQNAAGRPGSSALRG